MPRAPGPCVAPPDLADRLRTHAEVLPQRRGRGLSLCLTDRRDVAPGQRAGQARALRIGHRHQLQVERIHASLVAAHLRDDESGLDRAEQLAPPPAAGGDAAPVELLHGIPTGLDVAQPVPAGFRGAAQLHQWAERGAGTVWHYAASASFARAGASATSRARAPQMCGKSDARYILAAP